MAAQAQAIQAVLVGAGAAVSVGEIGGRFKRAPKKRLSDLLETLVGLGQIEQLETREYVARV